MCDSTLREILNLQIGHFSNCVGSHFWNCQESSFVFDAKSETDLNHDYFFQTGLTSKGQETYTPRLVIIDTLGSLGNLKCFGSLYENEDGEENHYWDQDCLKVQQVSHPKNEFIKDLESEEELLLKESMNSCDISSSSSAKAKPKKVYDLRNEVKYWSDYLRPHLHPGTINLLPSVWHWQVSGCADPGVSLPPSQPPSKQNPATNSSQHSKSLGNEQLWGFESGREAALVEDFNEDVTDSIRKYVERCNSLQGFQMTCHSYDGMGGVASIVSEHINDDYSNKILVAYPITPPSIKMYSAAAQMPLTSNTLQTYSNLYETCDIVVPINLKQHPYNVNAPVTKWPFYTYKESSPYESSAAAALLLETLTTCFRSKRTPFSLLEASSLLTMGGRKIVTASLGFPAPPRTNAGGSVESLLGMSGVPLERRSPAGVEHTEVTQREVVVRRGHLCEQSSRLYQAKDPVHLAPPFPVQCLTNLPTVAGAVIDRISSEARLAQGRESTWLVELLSNEIKSLTTRRGRHCASIIPNGEEIAQQWLETCENYGIARGVDDESD